MSDQRKISALLPRGAMDSIAGHGLARLVISGVRLLPFRAALGLLLSGVRVKERYEGSKKEVRRTSEPRRNAPPTRAARAGQSGKGGSYHG